MAQEKKMCLLCSQSLQREIFGNFIYASLHKNSLPKGGFLLEKKVIWSREAMHFFQPFVY